MSVIDEVKQRTDIIEVIGQYTTLTKAGRTFRALCPFHSEKHPSFFVYPEQQSWHCFGACNTGGDVFSFLMKKENINFGDALRLLAEKAGITIPSRFKPEEDKEEKEELYQVNEAATQYFHNLLLNSPAAEKARHYVASRGFSPQAVADFQLGFSLDSWESLKQYLLEKGYTESVLLTTGLVVETENGRTHDRFRGRLMFPIHDAKGHTLGFGARALDDSLPKYLNSPQTSTFDKSNILYGINLATAAIRQQDMAVIVEGYIDVITAHQNGITNIVASMGTSITENQVSTLKKLTRNLVLALDADTAGEEAMLRGVNYENTLDTEVRVIVLPAGKDPDDVIKEDTEIWRQLVKESLPVVDYTFNTVVSKLDLTTARDKSLAREKLLPIVAEIEDTTRQTHYLGKLASLTKDNIRDLETVLREIKTSRGRRKTQTPRPETITHALRPLISDPREEYCLTLLLQHPELKDMDEALYPEYFASSENREIFTLWQQSDNLLSFQEKLDATIHEYVDTLLNKSLPSNNVEDRFADCALGLRKKYLRSLEAKRAEVFAIEVETGGAGADLAKLEAEGIEPSKQLREIFTKKKRRSELRR